jgi:hypothetical protein
MSVRSFRLHCAPLLSSDLGDARDAVRQALSDAPADEAPGLRRAARIRDELAERGGEPRVRWARGILERDGVVPVAHEVASIRALRQELPGLAWWPPPSRRGRRSSPSRRDVRLS